MITMIDEIFDRTYQAGRSDLHSGLDAGVSRLINGVTASFETLRRIQFAAPWAASSKRNDAGCA
jgi:hypothetical protein